VPEHLGSYAHARLLGVLCGLASWSVETPFLQLHTGVPGEGVSNVAACRGRRPLLFADPVGGVARNSDELFWGSGDVVADESLSAFSVWSSRVGGVFLWSGRLAPAELRAGDEFRIPVGALSVIIEEPA